MHTPNACRLQQRPVFLGNLDSWKASSSRRRAAVVPARRYQLRVCVEACKHRLLTIDNRSISWNTALSMLHLPPGLQEGDAFAALTEVRPT